MKAQTIITITRDQTEEMSMGLKELLNSPIMLGRTKDKLKESLSDFFDCNAEDIEVDFKQVEE